MTERLLGYTALAGGLGFLAFVMVVASAISTKIALVLVPGFVIGALLALNPFPGLVLLVLLAQLDAVSNIISTMLPVSFYKLLSAATLAGFAVAWVGFPQRQRRALLEPELRYALLFILALCMSFLQAEHKGAALDHMIGFVSVMLLFGLVIGLTDTRRQLEILLCAVVLSGLVSGLIVIAESLLGIRILSTATAAVTAESQGGVARSAGASDNNPTTAAHMLLVSTMVAGVMFFQYPRFKALTGMALLVGLPALVLTFARSAALAAAVMTLIYAWQNRHHRLFPFVALCGLAVGAAAVPFVPDSYWERMATLLNFDTDRTLFRRISYNLIGADLFSRNPILGVGPGNFPDFYAGQDYRFFPGREPLPRRLHNTYMEVAAELGTLGLTTFLLAVIAPLRRAIRTIATAPGDIAALARALAFGLGAFLVASFFMPNEDTKYMWILPGLCVAVARVAQHEPTKADD